MTLHLKAGLSLILLLTMSAQVLPAIAQTAGDATTTTVSGTVHNAVTGETLEGINVAVRGRLTGVSTHSDGSFRLSTRGTPPITLIITGIGYRAVEITINEQLVTDLAIELEPQPVYGSELVVSASRVQEHILRSPVSIEAMDVVSIRETPSPNFYDAIADLQGVQFNTSGLTFKSINTRGFATFANVRFVQLIDGMDNAPPGLNFPAGNLVGISELDVESIELIPGAASALYGPNAFNGILLINSKSPFDYEGLSVQAGSGLTNQTGIEDPAGNNLYYDFSLRYAQRLNDRFAFKFNAAAMQGTDWHAADYRDVDDHPMNAGHRGSRETNPSYDGLNIYGDEVATTMNLDQLAMTPPGTFGSIHVSRTGYREVDLIDYNAASYKLDAALHFRPTEHLEASYQYRLGTGTGIYQGFSRYSLENIRLQYHKVELKGTDFFLRAYGSFEDAGDSYDSRFLAWNINRTWKSDQNWFQQYAQTFVGARNQGASEDEAHTAARNAADTGRLEPGTSAFEDVRDEIKNRADLATGAKFIDRSNFLHAEGLYDFRSLTDVVDIQMGGSIRQYNLNSEGTIFNDEDGVISNMEMGAYAQLSRSLINDRLRLTGSGRMDKNENFDPQFSPRASAVFSLDQRQNHNVRASFQTGFRNPDTQSQYIALDLGPAFLIGGAEDNIDNLSRETTLNNGSTATLDGRDAYDNAYEASAVQEASQAGTPVQAVQILMQGVAHTDFIQPEQIQSIEAGYKGFLADRFFIDLSFYHNWYNNFQIAKNVVAVPQQYGDVNSPSGALAIQNGNFKVVQLYTNTEEEVTSQGFNINLNYLLPGGYTIGGHYNWAEFSLQDDDSDFQAGFNTPNHRFGFSLGNRRLTEQLGFNLSYRWSDAYTWQSTFGVGEVSSYQTLDLQLTWAVPALNSTIKAGGANILNQGYNTAFGGPEVGAQYYITLRYDSIFRR